MKDRFYHNSVESERPVSDTVTSERLKDNSFSNIASNSMFRRVKTDVVCVRNKNIDRIKVKF